MINEKFINHKHPLLDAGILSDRGIREAIATGKIKTGIELDDDQFQPNSLDLRIKSAEIYTTKQTTDANNPLGVELIRHKYSLRKNQPLLLPVLAHVEIYFAEKLKTDYGIRIDLRSGRGRRGLVNSSGLYFINTSNEPFIEIRNQGINNIKVYGADTIAHAFFYTSKEEGNGYVVSDPDELEEIAYKLSPDMKTDPPYLVFNAGEFALRQKKAEFDDTRGNQDLFEKVMLEDKNTFQDRHLVVQLSPRITVPNDVAVQLLPSIPYTSEIYNDKSALFYLTHSFVEKGGWAESGHIGNLTAHLSVYHNFFFIEKNQPLVYALAYKYKQPVQRPYSSSGLNSHYQNSKGDVIKS